MSFAGEVKTELCRAPLSRRCCVLAEAYGVLLYCNAFQTNQVRVVTECAAFAQRLPPCSRRRSMSPLTACPRGGKAVFVLDSREKLSALRQAYGMDGEAVALHVNFAVLEENCCRASFLRGAFLAGGR